MQFRAVKEGGEVSVMTGLGAECDLLLYISLAFDYCIHM